MGLISKIDHWSDEVGGFAMRWAIIVVVLGCVGTFLVIQYVTDRD